MEAFYLYILQVNIGILAFYLLYRFLLVHDTFLEMRRAYWWLVWATVFAYPWVELHAVRGEAMPLQVVMADYVETITLVASAVAPVEAPSWTWQDALAGVWALGAAVLVVRFLVQLAVVCRLAWRGRKLVWHGQRVIALDSGEQPFSFFGWIFVNPEHYSEEELEEIMAHEATHARQRHSWDVVVFELLCCLFWFNPAVWLAKRYIRQNLEFLADRAVMRAGFDRKSYQYHLLRLSYGVGVEQIVNSFNVSLLKRRIMMMNRKKSGRTGALKYALLFPVAGLLVLSANAEAVAETAEHVAAQWTAPDGMVTMTGTVVDENGKPLPGVTVVLKGTMLGVRTDAAGTFSIQARQGQTLVFTYVGRQTQEVPFNPDKPDIRVVMPLVDTPLDAVEIASDGASKQASKGNAGEENLPVWDGAPKFPGGNPQRYIAENLRYPAEAIEKGIEGKVYVQFVIDTAGKVTTPKVVRGIHPLLDAEAIRLINEMPDWMPGQVNGKPVNGSFFLPVNFVLPENAQKTPETASAESLLQRAAGNAQSGKDTLIEQGEVFMVVEDMPKFPAGNIQQYVADNLRYPAAARENGIEGKVYVRFVIDTTGKAIAPEIIRGVSPELDAEALRLIREMPAWKPGMQRGKPVRVSFTLPINFRLTPEKQENPAAQAAAAPSSTGDYEPARPASGDLQDYLARNMRYPRKALKDKTQGYVHLFCTIDATGKLTQADVVVPVSPELDAEALRLVKSVPEWIPATMNGKPMESTPSIRVDFTLDENGKPLSPEAYKTHAAQLNKDAEGKGLRIAAPIVASFDTEQSMSEFLLLMSNPQAQITNGTVRGTCSQMDAHPLVSTGGKLYTSGFDWSSVNAASLRQIMVFLNVREVSFDGKPYDAKTVVTLAPKK